MASRFINDCDVRLQAWARCLLSDFSLSVVAHSTGQRLIIDCTYRSNAEQDADFAQGRDSDGNPDSSATIITWARGGQSAHNCVDPEGNPAAKAFDIAIVNADGTTCDWNDSDPAWTTAHQLGRSYVDSNGNRVLQLGADWPHPKTDNPHFELMNWQSI